MQQLAPSQVGGLAAVPQALDDQWVPQNLLRRPNGDRTTPLDQVRADLDMTIDLASITVKDPRGAAEAVIGALRDRQFVDESVPAEAGREAEVINDPNLAAR